MKEQKAIFVSLGDDCIYPCSQLNEHFKDGWKFVASQKTPTHDSVSKYKVGTYFILEREQT